MLALVDEFHDFFEKIQLNETQDTRIKSAIKALSAYLSSQYDIPKKSIFVQGSFSTNTVTKPAPSQEDGEYDVDLIVLCGADNQSPSESIDDLLTTIEANSTYKEKVEKDDLKIPCVRLRYADESNARFHVDIVPSRRIEERTIEIPRRNVGWEISNPEDYTDWVLSLGERYRRTIMFLRRWRDENQVPIKSIVLQVLVANSLSQAKEDVDNLCETLENLHSYLCQFETTPKLFNPVLQEENLTERWSQEDFDSFKDELEETITIISKIRSESEHDDSCDLWQKILGEDFKYKTNKEFLATDIERSLGDFSHAKTLSQYSIPFKEDPGVLTKIEANLKWSIPKYRTHKKTLQKIKIKDIVQNKSLSSGASVKKNKEIEFHVHVHGLKNQDYKVYWQVVNTGSEAISSDGLRGEIFPSKDQNRAKWNKESTLYHGTHWIEAYIVKNSVCISRSGRFYIRIE